MKPVSLRVAAVASLVAAAIGFAGGIWALLRAGALARDAHRRDARVSEHAFNVLFGSLGVTVLAVSLLAVLAVWALWRGRRWAWWFLVVLSALGCVSLLRPRSLASTVGAVPSVVALVALLLPGSRRYGTQWGSAKTPAATSRM